MYLYLTICETHHAWYTPTTFNASRAQHAYIWFTVKSDANQKKNQKYNSYKKIFKNWKRKIENTKKLQKLLILRITQKQQNIK